MHLFALPDYPTSFWVIAVFVMLLTGLGKSGFGSGIGALATPLLALTIPVADAAALLLPLLIIMDIFTIPYYRGRFHWGHLRILMIGALLGIAIGGYYFTVLSHNERAMKMGIGALAVLFVLIQVVRSFLLGKFRDQPPPRAVGWLMGAVGGFTSTVAHAGGPPVTIYLLPQGLQRDQFVGTVALLFGLINVVKLVPYYYLGLLRVSNITTILLLAPLAYILRMRTGPLRNLGACLSPDNAWVALQGIETLPLRMERHCENALAAAKHLQSHPAVEWVRFPGLTGDPQEKLNGKYLHGKGGSMVVFGIKGGAKAGAKFIDSLKMFKHLANVGDAKSLAIHPATTTHSQLNEEQQRAAGIPPELIRLSIGIEHIDDILADLDQALAVAK